MKVGILTFHDGFNYGAVCSCVYNVQTVRGGDGEIVSGRVLDSSGEPLAGVVLHLKAQGEIIGQTETDDQGIYAFDYLQSNTPYTVAAALRGYGFASQEVTTGISQDDSVVSGNLWGVDLVGLLCDFNSDQKVDLEDMIMLIEHWGENASSFDVAPAPSGDGKVDIQDLELLVQYWGKEVDAPEFGLVARWKLDEVEGDTAHDSVAGHDGTLEGCPIWQPASGRVDGALWCDGVDDYVATPFVLNPAGGPFGVFAWVQNGAPGQVIFSQAGGANWLMVDNATGALLTQLRGSGRSSKDLVSAQAVTDGQWHRVGFTWDGANRVLYVDDVEVARDSQGTPAASAGGLYIGAGSALAPGTFWSGLIDDVRLYNRAVQP